MPSDIRPNVFADNFSIERGGLRGEMVARLAGAERLGGTLYELAPGVEAIPLHIHHANEELLIVLDGTPTLRTLDGESQLAAGDVVAFPTGRRGAHAVLNRGETPIRYLIVSTKVTPEVVEYPEQGTVGVMTRAPFDPPREGDDPADILRLRFRRDDAVQ